METITELLKIMEENGLHKIAVKRGDQEIALEKATATTHVVESAYIPNKEPQEVATAIFVTSPMVGTFYTAASPEDSALVKVGDVVSDNTIVGIIEAMKVMNEVRAGKAGKVVEICTGNGEPVEFGSKLFRIE